MLRRTLTAIALVTVCLAAGAHSTRDSEAIGFATVYTVDTISDANLTACDQFTPGDCSLRGAINDANAHPNSKLFGADSIFFSINPGGIQTITPALPLPAITDAVVIDATGQQENGQSCIDVEGRPCVVLDGGGNGFDGLTISANGVTVRGLSLIRFSDVNGNGTAINITSGMSDTIAHNFIGTADGTTSPDRINWTGVRVAAGASLVTIGGTTPSDRNVIFGNGTAVGLDGSQNIVEGNYFGESKAGGQVGAFFGYHNSYGVRVFGSQNTIGGTAPGAGNVIGASGFRGISLEGGSQNQVLGNYIGTDATGTAAVYNSFGIIISTSTNNIIGGTDPAARNVISGNGDGIRLAGASANDGNQIFGNYIGLNAAGTAALPNSTGVSLFGDNTSPQTIDGNVIAYNAISGNTSQGIDLEAETGSNVNNNEFVGNIIGLNAAGTEAVPNGSGGILIRNGSTGEAANNLIWGDDLGQSPNIISGNSGDGITVFGAGTSKTSITGNLIGTNAAGTDAIGNAGSGVDIYSQAQDNSIARNTIAGNGLWGIFINQAGSNGNRILRNYIGTNASLASGLGNTRDGLYVRDAAANVIGSETATSSLDNARSESAAAGGNVIRNNAGIGVRIDGAGAIGNAIAGNSIDDNGGLGIHLVAGGNGNTAAPVLTSALTTGGNTEVHGSYTNDPQHDFTAEFFASPSCDPSGNGEGRDFLGAATIHTDGSGIATFAATVPGSTGGKAITATVTVPASGNTSEFSNCVTAAGPTATPRPTPTATPHATPTPTATPSGLNGDANCDGKVDPADALAILGDADGVTPHAPCQNVEDVDCNGHVEGLDALRVLRWFIGAPMSHPAGCPEVGDPLT